MQAASIFLYLFVLSSTVQGYEDYSPSSMCTCGYPHHGKNRAQTSACPITITTNVSSFNFLDFVQVNITGFEIEGLVLRARSEILDWAKPYGSFVKVPANTKAFTWYNFPDTCVTHTGEIGSDHLEFVWWATGLVFPVHIYFVATIADSYEVFWINCTSPSLTFTGPATSGGPKFPEQAAEQALPFDNAVCGNDMKCMRYPNNCDKSKDCEAIIAYKNNGTYTGPVANADVLIFQMWVKDAEWVSLAFSTDRKMSGKDDGDLVLLCGESNGRRTGQVGWNSNGEELMYQIHANVHTLEAEVRRDGNEVSCTLVVYSPFDAYIIDERTTEERVQPNADYWDKEYCFFIGFGEFYPESPQPMKHVRMPVVSKSCQQKLSTADVIEFRAVDLFIQSHAAMNTLAWLFLITAATVLARHRGVAENKMWQKKLLWFQLHQIVMYVGAVLTVVGTILAFIFRLGWSMFATAHSVLGLVVTAFTLAQFIIAWARPKPTSPKKKIFLWVHRILTILCVVLAFVTEMVAVTMPSFPRTVQVGGALILVAWFLTVLGVELFMEFQSAARKNAVREKADPGLSVEQRPQQPCGGRIAARICFIGMVIITAILSIALIALLAVV